MLKTVAHINFILACSRPSLSLLCTALHYLNAWNRLILSLLVSLAFIFYHMVTFIRYIDANFTFGLVDCVVRYNEDFVKSRCVKSRLCSMHFTVILAGLKKIVRYTENFVMQRFVKSRFNCISQITGALIQCFTFSQCCLKFTARVFQFMFPP